MTDSVLYDYEAPEEWAIWRKQMKKGDLYYIEALIPSGFIYWDYGFHPYVVDSTKVYKHSPPIKRVIDILCKNTELGDRHLFQKVGNCAKYIGKLLPANIKEYVVINNEKFIVQTGMGILLMPWDKFAKKHPEILLSWDKFADKHLN